MMMKWFLIIILSLFCFSSLAQVVCRSPENIGDKGSEAGSISSACNEAVLAAQGDASDRDVNIQQTTMNIQGGDVADTPGETTSPVRGDDSGVKK
ncbi:MAG: hypothetical protein F4X95_00470 [Oligoflexia bacterium]|nr:hypothetical protein [Oligoflexia bacterium]